MTSFLSAGSTLAQAFILLAGGFVMLSYSATVIGRTFENWSPLVSWKDLANRMTYLVLHLSLVGLYALFAYFIVAEEMSDEGFRALEQILGGGI